MISPVAGAYDVKTPASVPPDHWPGPVQDPGLTFAIPNSLKKFIISMLKKQGLYR
jgi:hypothetical protein